MNKKSGRRMIPPARFFISIIFQYQSYNVIAVHLRMTIMPDHIFVMP